MAVPVETDSDIKSSSESDDDTPLAKIAKRYRRENETSDEEDNIPLVELGKCFRARQIFDQNQTSETMSSLKSSDSNDSINSLCACFGISHSRLANRICSACAFVVFPVN
jgi:hypothetical protein